MYSLLAEVMENVNTGTFLDYVPVIIAGCVVVAAVILWLVMSQVSKNKKKKRKEQKKLNSKNGEE